MDIIISPAGQAGQVVFSEEKWFVKYKKNIYKKINIFMSARYVILIFGSVFLE